MQQSRAGIPIFAAAWLPMCPHMACCKSVAQALSKIHVLKHERYNLADHYNEHMFQWKGVPTLRRGIICGTDANQEWLLPWWWERYSACNAYPVTFVDFGMSPRVRKWCEARGTCLSLALKPHFVARKETIDPALRKAWEADDRWDLWRSRQAWFYKPFALLHSPYEEAVWLDLDCEVLKPLDALFGRCDLDSQIALYRSYAVNHSPRFDPAATYSSGVIAFLHGVPIIQCWAKTAFSQNARFWGDDIALAHTIRQERVPVVELEDEYNWYPAWGLHVEATIVHWITEHGKEFIAQQGGFKPLIEQLFAQSN